MLKAGIIGCGSIGRRHVRGYLDAARYELAAIADPRAEALDEMDEEFGGHASYTGRRYSDGAEMLDAEDLDVVSVAVWHRGHAPWTIEAAKRGVAGVVCEKPMAGSLAEARQMLDACAERGTKLVIGHQRRFLPSYTLARQMIADGAIGDVQLARCYSNDGLLNWASHFMDMFRYVLDDDCEWVMGSIERTTDRYERDLRVEDRAVCTLGFKGGATGLILSGLDPHYYQGGFFYGTEGTIDLTPERLRLLNGDTGGWEEHAPDGLFFETGTGVERVHGRVRGPGGGACGLGRGQGGHAPRRSNARLQGFGDVHGGVRVRPAPPADRAAIGAVRPPAGQARGVGAPTRAGARQVRHKGPPVHEGTLGVAGVPAMCFDRLNTNVALGEHVEMEVR